MSSSVQTAVAYPKPVHPKAPFSFRRHIVPPLLGLTAFASVFGLMNAQYLTAQIQYHFTSPLPETPLVVNTAAPNPQSVNIMIPKINVDAPVVYDEKSYSEDKIQLALRRGVVHYGQTALPGQAGNIVILGHSSGQPWAPGDYKFVFTMLEKLEINDSIILDYRNTRYIFRVSTKEVVKPTDLSVVAHTTQPTLTLITCTPVGTDENRLVIKARQISPKPETAKPMAPEDLPVLPGVDLPS